MTNFEISFAICAIRYFDELLNFVCNVCSLIIFFSFLWRVNFEWSTDRRVTNEIIRENFVNLTLLKNVKERYINATFTVDRFNNRKWKSAEMKEFYKSVMASGRM